MSSFLHLAGKSKKQDRVRGATLPRASIAAILETPMTGSTAAWDSKLRGLEAQGFGV